MKYDQPLSLYTTLRIGGPAERLAEVRTAEELRHVILTAKGRGDTWRVLGEGSNVLVPDEGLPGVTIVFRSDAPPEIDDSCFVRVSAGFPLQELVFILCERGLGGLENLAGIPGTVGGAIVGNAGAYGTAIGECVRQATLIEPDGALRASAPGELSFSYRASALKGRQAAVVDVLLEGRRADPALLWSLAQGRLKDRAVKHPDPKVVPTAGSWFKNVGKLGGEMASAGRLLEEADCKELCFGGASVWPKHANIVVTNGQAAAADVLALTAEMSRRVERRFGLRLESEVRYLDR